jgi:hypothetical protein
VGHHRVVVQDHPQAFAVVEMHRGGLAKLEAVDRPGVTLHVAGQVELDLALGPAWVHRPADGRQVGEREYLAAVVAQADAGVVEIGARHVHPHVGARAVFGTGMAHDLAGRRQPAHRHAVLAVIHGHRAVVHPGHLPVIHPCHRAMVHAGHAATGHSAAHRTHHVGHRQPLHGIQLGHRRTQSLAHGQRPARITAAVHRLSENGVGLVLRLDEHIVGFARAEAKFVDAHRLDVDAVRLHDGHLEAGDAHVVEGVAGAVDEAQAQALAGAEQAGPVAGRRGSVHQVGERCRRQIGQVGRTHAHFVPHLALADRRLQALARGIAEELDRRRLVVVVVVALGLELGEYLHRILIGPVGQLHHEVAVGADRFPITRLDDDRAVHAGNLLHAGVRVVPVGAALLEAGSDR